MEARPCRQTRRVKVWSCGAGNKGPGIAPTAGIGIIILGEKGNRTNCDQISDGLQGSLTGMIDSETDYSIVRVDLKCFEPRLRDTHTSAEGFSRCCHEAAWHYASKCFVGSSIKGCWANEISVKHTCAAGKLQNTQAKFQTVRGPRLCGSAFDGFLSLYG